MKTATECKPLLACILLALATGSAKAQPLEISLPLSQTNTHVQDVALLPGGVYPDDLTGGISLPDSYTGNVALGGVPFTIPTAGQNGWNSFKATGPNPRVLDIPVNLPGVTEVHTLINTYWGQSGFALASLEFLGTNGAYFRKDLIGGIDIRDYNRSFWTNTINGTTTIQVAAWGSGQRLDKQRIELPSTFGNEVLTSIRLSDTGGDTFIQRVLLAGITAVVQVTPSGLARLVAQSVTDPAVVQGLTDKLNAIAAAIARGNAQAKAGIVGAFINQVNAQTGKSITTEQAAILIQLVSAL